MVADLDEDCRSYLDPIERICDFHTTKEKDPLTWREYNKFRCKTCKYSSTKPIPFKSWIEHIPSLAGQEGMGITANWGEVSWIDYALVRFWKSERYEVLKDRKKK